MTFFGFIAKSSNWGKVPWAFKTLVVFLPVTFFFVFLNCGHLRGEHVLSKICNMTHSKSVGMASYYTSLERPQKYEPLGRNSFLSNLQNPDLSYSRCTLNRHSHFEKNATLRVHPLYLQLSDINLKIKKMFQGEIYHCPKKDVCLPMS